MLAYVIVVCTQLFGTSVFATITMDLVLLSVTFKTVSLKESQQLYCSQEELLLQDDHFGGTICEVVLRALNRCC